MYGKIGGYDNHAVWAYHPVFASWRHAKGFNVVTAGLPKGCRGRAHYSRNSYYDYVRNANAKVALDKVRVHSKGVRGVWAINQKHGYAARFGSRFAYRHYKPYVYYNRKYSKMVGFFKWKTYTRRVTVYRTSGYTWNC